MAGGQDEVLRLEVAVGPANLDLGRARVSRAEVQDDVVLRPVVPEAATDVLGLRDTVGGDANPRSDRGAVGRRPLETELDVARILSIGVLECAHLAGLVAVVGAIRVAACSRMTDDQV